MSNEELQQSPLWQTLHKMWFDTYKLAYQVEFYTKQDLAKFVKAGDMFILASDYREIVGEDYVPPTD